jgi:hypothetical protein
MGPCNQLKKMFAKTRIIATLLVLVSGESIINCCACVLKLKWNNSNFCQFVRSFYFPPLILSLSPSLFSSLRIPRPDVYLHFLFQVMFVLTLICAFVVSIHLFWKEGSQFFFLSIFLHFIMDKTVSKALNGCRIFIVLWKK